MNPRELLDMLHVAERLKDATRHCTTSGRRPESVAEHSWRMALMAYFLRDAFPEADMDKVVRMCLIHDLGEAFTGDIPTFDKTKADEITEAEKNDLADVEKKIADEKSKKEAVISKYAAGNKVVHQLIDLALLQNGILKGEALNNFVKRSIELI